MSHDRPTPRASEPASEGQGVNRRSVTRQVTGRRASARLTVTRDPAIGCTVDVTVLPGWFVYSPGSDDGVPTSVQLTKNGTTLQVDQHFPAGQDGHLTGRFSVAVTGLTTPDVETPGALNALLRLQACNGRTCEMPEVLRFGAIDTDPAGDGALTTVDGTSRQVGR